VTPTGRKMDKKFHAIVERSIQGILIIQNFRVVYANQAFAKISGYSKKELLSLTPAQVEKAVHPDFRALVWGRVRTRLQDKKAILRYEFKGFRKDGSIRWMEMVANRIDYEGKPAILGAIIDITERKKAEEALQKNQANLMALIENSKASIWSVDRDFRLLAINSYFKKMFAFACGVDLEVGKKITEGVSPKMKKTWIARYNRALKGESFVVEEDFSIAGETINSEISFNPIRNNGEITGVAVFAREITEQKKAQEILKESEDKYKSIIDLAPDGIVTADLRGVITSCNSTFLKQTGLSRDKLVGKHFSKMPGLFKSDISAYLKVIAAMIKGKPIPSFEAKWKRADGLVCWGEIHVAPLKKDRKITGFQAITRDITERKHTEEALRESEEKYRAIFESFHDVYYRTDREGLVTIISPSVRSHAGWDPEDIIGHPVTDFYEDPSERENFKEKLKESGVINDHELKLLAKDGRVINVSVRPKGVEGVLRDITDRKRAEEQIKSSLKEKEVLLQEIHHRVKNNMQIISSLLNLQSGHIKDDKVRDMFKMSRDRIKSMALIHEKLYQSEDLAKINFAQYIRSLTIHLLHTYNASADRIKLNADVRDVFLDINKAIPCGLILNELVSNSLKHAFPQDRTGNICIQFRAGNNGDVRLEVSDDGIGFSDKVDFEKPDSLGLQLVNDLVEQLGGKLELNSRSGTSYQISFSS
jgi:PAS domain S-box-containing protein